MSAFKRKFMILLFILSASVLAGCGGESNKATEVTEVTQVTQTPEEVSLAVIQTYARNNAERAPSVQDYKNIGLIDITAEKAVLINQQIQELDSLQVDTIEELQAVGNSINTIPEVSVTNGLPKADAGSDQQLEIGKKLILTGKGTDKEGAVTFQWMEGSTILANKAELVYESNIEGIHTLTLIVTDTANQSSKDELIVTIIPAPTPVQQNKLPVANAGPNLTVAIGNSIQLVGSAVDTDGTIVSYLWEENGVLLSNNKLFSYTSSTAGVALLMLTVTDDDGGKASDIVSVNVMRPPNKLPVANAGPNKTMGLGSSIQLEGSAEDLDGTIVSYIWKENGVSLSQNKNFSYTPTKEGVVLLELIVTDNDGGKASDIVSVNVVKTSNKFPVANAGPNKTVDFGSSIQLMGSAVDPDGTIVSYEWRENGTSLSQNKNLSYTPKKEGVVLLELIVTDNDGGEASDIVSINAVKNNNLPVANAGSNKTVEVGKTVQLVGSAVDTDGTIVSYSWKKDGVEFSKVKSANYTSTTVGTVILELVVTDNDGGKASDKVSVVVTEESPAPELIVSAGNDIVTEIGADINIEAQVTNNIGAVTYEWRIDEKIINTQKKFSYVMEAAGSYILEITIKSESGKTAKDTLKILVNKQVALDTVPPTITLKGNELDGEVIQGNIYADKGASAQDDIDGDISDKIKVTGLPINVNAAPGSTFTIKYNVSDSSGNKATETVRTVKIVAKNNDPYISLKGMVNTHVYKGVGYTDAGAYATKDRAGDLNYKMVVGGDTVNSNAALNTVFTISYNVTDEGGVKALTRYRYVKVVALGSNLVPAIDEADKELMLGIINAKRLTGMACNNFQSAPALVWNNNLYGASYEFAQDQGESGVYSLDQGSGTIHDWTGFAQGGKSYPDGRNGRHGYTGGGALLLSGTLFFQFENMLSFFLANDQICRQVLSPGFTDLGSAIYFKAGNYDEMSFVIQVGQH